MEQGRWWRAAALLPLLAFSIMAVAVQDQAMAKVCVRGACAMASLLLAVQVGSTFRTGFATLLVLLTGPIAILAPTPIALGVLVIGWMMSGHRDVAAEALGQLPQSEATQRLRVAAIVIAAVLPLLVLSLT